MAEIIPLPDSFAALLRWIEAGAMDVELAQRAGWITSSDPLKLTELGREALDQHMKAQKRQCCVAALRRCKLVAFDHWVENDDCGGRRAAMEIANGIQKLIDAEEARNG